MLDKIPDFKQIAKQLIIDAQTIAEVEMIKFVLGNFEKQGFMDASLEPWQERAIDDSPGRAILTQSAALRDSFKLVSSSTKQVVVGSDSKYAKIHNEGGIVHIPITKKMRKYFWYKYYTIADKNGNIRSGSASEASMYKAIALSKKTHLTIKMPKRQMIGDSVTFNREIDLKFIKMIESRFKT
jgi:phage gpG-like protein